MTALFDRLVQASLEANILIASVWLVCRLAPALPASFRVVLWWLATLKLLVGVAWESESDSTADSSAGCPTS